MKLNQNNNQRFPIKLATASLAAAAVAFTAFSMQASAIGTEETVNQKPLAAEFKKLDANSDQKLTPTEVSNDKDIVGKFEQADIDKDGVLNADEYANYKSGVQQERVKAYLDDATVTAKVKAELIKDAGMDGIDISVETHKGQVILSGFVNNGEQLLRAVHIASGVSGVQSVKNALVIRG